MFIFNKGLVFTINALETWLYDENNPTSRLETNKIFKTLNEKVETNSIISVKEINPNITKEDILNLWNL